jgi:rubrerythrin
LSAITEKTKTGFDLDGYLSRSKSLDLNEFDWHEVARYAIPVNTIRALRYMHDIESHTLVYLRTLLSTRAIDDPEIGPFLACWLYEETFHGLAFGRFLAAAGYPVPWREHGDENLMERLQGVAAKVVSRIWPNFICVHMLWGAINELTTMQGYKRLAQISDHPVLIEMLRQIARDEARHFSFYFHQARQRLKTPRDARMVRRIIEWFWAPVGSGVQPARETRFLSGYLFSGAEGRAAALKIDETIRSLPYFDDIELFTAWYDRHVSDDIHTEAVLP